MAVLTFHSWKAVPEAYRRDIEENTEYRAIKVREYQKINSQVVGAYVKAHLVWTKPMPYAISHKVKNVRFDYNPNVGVFSMHKPAALISSQFPLVIDRQHDIPMSVK